MLQVSSGNRNRVWILALLIFALCSGVVVAQSSTATNAQQRSQSGRTPRQENDDILLPPEGVSPEKAEPAAPGASVESQSATPAVSVPENQPTPANQPGNTVSLPPEGREAEKNSSGTFVFKADVQEVTLHATVVDDHLRPVTTLNRTAFQVFEDGKTQRITSFRREDIPVALGIVIDNSGSMRDKRPGVNAAALNLVRSSNQQDQVFIVNFNNEYYLDQDYTGNVSLLRDALERIESRGGTALYDAVVATSDHLMKSAKLAKKVILVVTDGEDTASRDTLEQATRAVAVDGGATIYTIGLLGKEREKKARRALRILAEQTGGVAFFPGDVYEVEAISQQIAHDIRNQYTIGYRPSTPKTEGGYRQVKVDAMASGYKRLTVRTRSGYYATGERAASAKSANR
jgi:Ca-activated chloride channel family protein